MHWESPRWVGSMGEADRRVAQLAGRDSLTSWMLRPLALDHAPDSMFRVILYHPQLRAVYNRDVPYGMNDGALWAGRGWNAAVEGGVELRWRVLTARLAPAVTWSQNREFALAPLSFASTSSPAYADQFWSDRIDRPQRFGDRPFARVDAGQSVIRVDWRGAVLGFGTENMWWGPGIDNAILMTNSAAGFPRAFVGTSRPVNVWIGRLEAMYLAGRLYDSEWFRTTAYPEHNRRWINGVAAVLEPRGAPGLSLGAARMFYAYLPEEGLSFRDFLNILQPVQKKRLMSPSSPSGNDSTDQMVSVFARYAFPQVGFEVYGEWGRNDHGVDTRDYILAPDHATGFLIGFRKVFTAERRQLSIRGELTALAEGRTAQLRPAPPWYAHHFVRQGYTHRGQMVGAGIGPGSDMQTLSADWARTPGLLSTDSTAGEWSIGVIVQRLRNDADGFYRLYAPDGIFNNNYLKHDVTMSGGVRGSMRTRHARVQGSILHDYQRNRYALLRNDVHNIRFELRTELLP